MRGKPPYKFGDDGLDKAEYRAVLLLFYKDMQRVPRESPDIIFGNLSRRFGRARIAHAVNTLRGYGQDAGMGHGDPLEFTYERVTKTDVALRPARLNMGSIT
jgi:hypothetical protein